VVAAWHGGRAVALGDGRDARGRSEERLWWRSRKELEGATVKVDQGRKRADESEMTCL
jgi:hypothetical protein